jgi:hypothetical protein
MKWLTLFVLAGALLLATAGPAFADMTTCDMTTIDSLSMCVQHAQSAGLITNDGVAKALLSQVSAAQTAYAAGQTGAAVNALRAFIALVQAQAGITIDPTYALHVMDHAQKIIMAISS